MFLSENKTKYDHLKRKGKIGRIGSIVHWIDSGLDVAGKIARRHQRPNCGHGYTSLSFTGDDLYFEEIRIITITIGCDDPCNLFCPYSVYVFVCVLVT